MLWDALGCSGMLWDALGYSGTLLGCSGTLWNALECSGMPGKELWSDHLSITDRDAGTPSSPSPLPSCVIALIYGQMKWTISTGSDWLGVGRSSATGTSPLRTLGGLLASDQPWLLISC